MCVVVSSFYSCLKSKKEKLPKNVVETISQSAALNRVALNRTIVEYLDNDTLKLQAAYYLISNLLHQYWVDHCVVDSADSIFAIEPHSFFSGQELRSYWDSLENTVEIHFKGKKFVRDIDTMRSEFLINNIEKSFKTKDFCWTESVSDSMFLNYVLPYRFGNEPIYNWRDSILTDYNWVFDSMNGNNDPARLVSLINDFVNQKYTYDDRYFYEANIQTYSGIKKSRIGNYQDISYLKASILRTFGIPATVDYIPHLDDSIGTFYFTVAFDSDGQSVPLLSKKEKNILQQSEIAKVYRRIFYTTQNSLNALKPISLQTPPFLGDYYCEDVTSEYVATNDIILDSNCCDTLMYIAVMNQDKWKAVDWSICKNGQVIFRDFGTKKPYQLTVMRKGKLVPICYQNQE